MSRECYYCDSPAVGRAKYCAECGKKARSVQKKRYWDKYRDTECTKQYTNAIDQAYERITGRKRDVTCDGSGFF